MKIILAEHQPKVRFALRVLLEQRSQAERLPWVVCGEAVDAPDLLQKVGIYSAEYPCDTPPPASFAPRENDKVAAQVAADLVLLDWDLPGMEHQALLAALQKYNPSLKVVVLSSRMEERQAALLAGADAFVSKADPPEKLMTTVSECWKKWRESLPFDLNTESAPAVPKAHSCRCFSHGGG